MSKSKKSKKNKTNNSNMGKLTYLMLCVDKKTHKPALPQCAVFATHAEALKAKGFLRKSGMLVLIVPLAFHDTKDDYCKLWKTNITNSMFEMLGIEECTDLQLD